MSARAETSAPEDLTVVEGADPIEVTFVTDEAPVNRVFNVLVNASSVLHWEAGSATVAGGFVADVTLGHRSAVVRVTRVGGWTPGAAVAWSATYEDDATAPVGASGRFVRATFTPVRRVPAAGARGVSRRVEIFRSYDVSAGSPRGVDLVVDGDTAVEGGEPARPNFTGTSASAGARAYATVTRRRDFRWGQLVQVVARPRVYVSGLVYRGRDESSFVVTGKPGPGPSIGQIETGPSPIVQAVREMVTATFRTRQETPDPKDAMVHFVLRSTLGNLLRSATRDELILTPQPEDIPSDRAILQLLADYAPLRSTFVAAAADPEDRAALEDAWRSGHPVEQLSSVLYLLFMLNFRQEQSRGGG